MHRLPQHGTRRQMGFHPPLAVKQIAYRYSPFKLRCSFGFEDFKVPIFVKCDQAILWHFPHFS
jgi:hypothetical protein